MEYPDEEYRSQLMARQLIDKAENPKRLSETSAAMNDLETVIGQLEADIMILNDRVSAVSSPDVEELKRTDVAGYAYVSPHALHIGELNTRLWDLSARIRNIVERLEI